MTTWTAPRLCRTIAHHVFGAKSFDTRGAVCVAVDDLRREIEVRRRMQPTFDQQARRWQPMPMAELYVEIGYPPTAWIEGPKSALSTVINFKVAVHRRSSRDEDLYYPWPTAPFGEAADDIFRDATDHGRDALFGLETPLDLGRLLLRRDSNVEVGGLMLGQYKTVAFQLRLVRALLIARLSGCDPLEAEALAEVDRELRNRRRAEELLDRAAEHRSLGFDELDDVVAAAERALREPADG
ncbi:hypothetical protein AB0M36_26640 [Actinoplanes sp. NPDC051346]|uniref:hypothetical protein n=1 Tax=Actinoplanes sp. NPDC051346 TaxID=3155048 RepID=UPI00342EA44B